MSNQSSRLGGFLSRWVDGVRRHAWLVVALSVLLSACAVWYTAANLGISTDTKDMLDPELHFRRVYTDYIKTFPFFDDTLLVVVDGDTPGLSRDAAKKLQAALSARQDLFSDVFLATGGDFLDRQGLLFLSTGELEDFADNMARVQPFLARLSRNPTLPGVTGLLEQALDAAGQGRSVDMGPFLSTLAEGLDAAAEGRTWHMSWTRLMSGDDPGALSTRSLVMAKPRLDFSKLAPGIEPMEAVRETAHGIGLVPENGVRVRLTGDIALETEELLSVRRGAELMAGLAFVLVGIVLFAGLRSPRLVLACLATLVMGLLWTAGFATVAVGHLNLISVAFAVLYIGLGVDYAIHFGLRYKDFVDQGTPRDEALRESARDVGSSLVICSLTTAVGFYAFVPTVFDGVAELGIIAGTGMFISLVANLTTLPALLALLPLSPSKPKSLLPDNRFTNALLTLPLRRRTTIRSVSVALAVVGLLFIPFATFNYNTLDLQPAGNESVRMFRELLRESHLSPWSLAAMENGREEAEQLAKRLTALPEVSMAVTASSFIPEKQGEKLGVIADMSLVLGPGLAVSGKVGGTPPDMARQALDGLASDLGEYGETASGGETAEEARRLRGHIRDFLDRADAAAQDERQRMYERLEDGLFRTLPGRLESFSLAMEADEVGVGDIPPEFARRWIAGDQRWLVRVFPAHDLDDRAAMSAFVDAVVAVAPDAIGFPVILVEAGQAVVGAFQHAFAYALVAITLLLFLLLEYRRDALLVLFPLLLVGELVAVFSVVFDVPFNFANVIALPLILGIGVDNGIHMVHRIHQSPPGEVNLLRTSTARGVFFSTLTTMCGFGNLAISPHPGTASMGLMLTAGIVLTLVSTLFVVPAMVRHRGPKGRAA